MYYQQSSGKVFWIAFITSLIVSSLVSFTMIYLLPQALSKRESTIEVPDVENLELSAAEILLKEKGLKMIVEDERFHPTVKKDRIIYQRPASGESVKRGSTIRLVVSKGQEETKEGELIVPSVIGFELNQARVFLSEKGLTVGVVEREESEEAKDIVLRTVPEPGQKITKDIPIKLVVSSGTKKVEVPNLRGLSEYRARLLLEERGLSLGRVLFTTSAEHSFDIIIYQNPKPGEIVSKGTKVDITINKEGG
ncbi:MAG: PASTA domain-containing protein [candidate division WOR-3 bacterium]